MLFCLGSCQFLNNDSSTDSSNQGDSTQSGSGLEDGKDDGKEDDNEESAGEVKEIVITFDLGTLSTDSYVQIEKTSITVKSGESYTIVSPT